MLTHSTRLQVFCPVCAVRREIERHRPTILKLIVQSLGIGSIVGVCIYVLASWVTSLWLFIATGLLSFLLFEFYDAKRSYRDLVCPVCDFDPVLYRRAPSAAEERVLKRLERRKRWTEQLVKLRLLKS